MNITTTDVIAVLLMILVISLGLMWAGYELAASLFS